MEKNVDIAALGELLIDFTESGEAKMEIVVLKRIPEAEKKHSGAYMG